MPIISISKKNNVSTRSTPYAIREQINNLRELIVYNGVDPDTIKIKQQTFGTMEFVMHPVTFVGSLVKRFSSYSYTYSGPKVTVDFLNAKIDIVPYNCWLKEWEVEPLPDEELSKLDLTGTFLEEFNSWKDRLGKNSYHHPHMMSGGSKMCLGSRWHSDMLSGIKAKRMDNFYYNLVGALSHYTQRDRYNPLPHEAVWYTSSYMKCYSCYSDRDVSNTFYYAGNYHWLCDRCARTKPAILNRPEFKERAIKLNLLKP